MYMNKKKNANMCCVCYLSAPLGFKLLGYVYRNEYVEFITFSMGQSIS